MNKFIREKDGNKTRYYYCDNNNKIEISEEIYKTHEKYERSERHHRRMLWKHNVLSSDAFLGDSELLYTEAISSESMEDHVIRKLLVNATINSLDLREQKIIKMFYFLGLSISEIADEMNLDVSTIKRIKSKSLRKMKYYLLNDCFGGNQA